MSELHPDAKLKEMEYLSEPVNNRFIESLWLVVKDGHQLPPEFGILAHLPAGKYGCLVNIMMFFAGMLCPGFCEWLSSYSTAA